MSVELFINPHGRPMVDTAVTGDDPTGGAGSRRIVAAFEVGSSQGLLHLATVELQTSLPPGLAFGREFGRNYLTRLCHTPGLEETTDLGVVQPPDAADLAQIAMTVPAIRGAEYLTPEVLAGWWTDLDTLVREEIAKTTGGPQAYLREKNPVWRLVGRVTFHLAENKRDPEHPFAFLATYTGKMTAHAKVLHQPLGRALQEYSSAKDKSALLSLLTPVQRAAEKAPWVSKLVESGDVYHPLAWNPRQAYQFLRDVPLLEQAGLIVRVPNWWKATRPPRPVVNVSVGTSEKSKIGLNALMSFNVGVTLEGQELSAEELAQIQSSSGLVLLKNKWVEVDREQLDQALKHWKKVEQDAKGGEVSFFEGMRLLAGATLETDTAAGATATAREWTGISVEGDLEKMLNELRDPSAIGGAAPAGLHAELRPYQLTGVNWLRFMARLNLGACLADDMGLGKTIQVISLLLHMQDQSAGKPALPSLLVLPASLIANWKTEIERFAPTLSMFVAHPSERRGDNDTEPDLTGIDLAITTYGMLARTPWIRQRQWRLVILDEAQAIKNAGTRQSRAVKELQTIGRVALTGTPVENRLSDLWSLFDFLNPGLLGSAKAFSAFVKKTSDQEHNPYGPLRTLVRPYILRRLKTDKKIIADLPDKSEVNAFCGLTRQQVAMYERIVAELQKSLTNAQGIQRRGIVLASLMRLKQICNHPSQLSGDGEYNPDHSGKFHRLRDICNELAERQEKPLVFTQFREMTTPLAEFLGGIFGRSGLILHGGTPVGKRQELVESFQREDGPPFFVLSIKAGGTGLNLTEASHVIHFDRWWNPAVENQATDRAFRIGQKRNVLVHKFVCRGTVEERIDEMITEKISLARDLLDEGGDVLLTEMDNDRLLKMVSLDVTKAIEAV
jgi:non-specific serine/threonine protein kinase